MRRLVIALVASATSATAVVPPAQAAPGLTAAVTRTGTQAKVVVTNSATTAVTGWSITVELPAGVTVSGAQNATTTQAGTRVTQTPAHYINTVGAGKNTDAALASWSIVFDLPPGSRPPAPSTRRSARAAGPSR
ncbi:MAG TPA: cellulose binding domain-containing protein [Umezawaea sp.]